MEIWDIYDDTFTKTGKTIIRGEELSAGENHLIVHIYPVNHKGEILIQKRTDTISWKPGMWAATGGGVESGEDAFTSCKRELNEELGIMATKDNSTLAFINKRKDHFCAVWIVEIDVDIGELVLQPAEVVKAKWALPKEIKEMMDEGSFVPYYYMEHLFHFIDTYINKGIY